tara:strand:- start:7896 stop:8132 length:237 start_codon:yes stop_codon:yes gene_type:complete
MARVSVQSNFKISAVQHFRWDECEDVIYHITGVVKDRLGQSLSSFTIDRENDVVTYQNDYFVLHRFSLLPLTLASGHE